MSHAREASETARLNGAAFGEYRAYMHTYVEKVVRMRMLLACGLPQFFASSACEMHRKGLRSVGEEKKNGIFFRRRGSTGVDRSNRVSVSPRCDKVVRRKFPISVMSFI